MTVGTRAAAASIAIVGVAIAIYTCRDRGDDPTSVASPRADAGPGSRVGSAGPRGSRDAPFEQRDRERQREQGWDPADRGAPDDAVGDAVVPGVEAKDAERLAESEPEHVVAPPPSPTADAARAKAQAAVIKAVADVHDQMKRDCWDGSDRGGEGSVEIGFSINFDAEGHAVTSSVQQGRSTAVDGLDRCLAPFAHGVQVPAPGEAVSVDVTFELP